MDTQNEALKIHSTYLTPKRNKWVCARASSHRSDGFHEGRRAVKATALWS